MLTVYLVGMRDGVARACRVAWSFGADRVVLVHSDPPDARQMQSARRLTIETAPLVAPGALLLEVNGRTDLAAVAWSDVEAVAVGGASFTFDRHLMRSHPSARIKTRPPCLIGDQALAVALFARSLAVPVPPC